MKTRNYFNIIIVVNSPRELLTQRRKEIKDVTKQTKYEKGFMLIPEESLGPCDNCGDGTIIKFCKKYGGYIGKCTACDINWRES